MEITKIVITGGPCAGKSTAMSWVESAFTQLGYRVLFVPETATELILGGVSPVTCGSNADFQRCILRLQLEKESIFEEAARTMDCEKVLIVCDRGCMDNRSYLEAEDFDAITAAVGSNEVELRDRYDAVFHLVTTAKGAEEFYTVANNSARTETPEEARRLDDRLIGAWTGHPHLRIIENQSSFEGKMKKLITEISSFLGEPEPLEVERKYLIEYPDTQLLASIPTCRKVEITQTYLTCPEGEERRVRKRGERGNYIYFETTKKTVTGEKRIELERRLSFSEYTALIREADPARGRIEKSRYCLTYEGQYFEIDVYPFWDDRAIVELEMSEEGVDPHFPDYIKVIKEVTDDPSFKNSALAKNIR